MRTDSPVISYPNAATTLLPTPTPKTYFFDESQLNAVGYWLLDERRPSEALSIFRLNLEEFPQSSNGFEGLGESYLGVGDTSKAIANLQRSLELNAKNQDAADVLRRLGIKP